MTKANYKVAEDWINGKDSRGSNMFSEDGVVYSYGHHFPIAFKNKNVILINCDRYSITSSRHQRLITYALKDAKWYECTTSEIKQAISNPEKPVVLTKYIKPSNVSHALDLLREAAKEAGVKRYPTSKIRNQMELLVFMNRL